MTAHRISAASLIAGAVLVMLVFALHPSHIVTTAVVGPFSLSQLVHGTALVAAPLLLLGMWAMAEWLGLNRPGVRLGLVFAALAMMLTVNAAIISNFVTPAAARASMGAMHHAPPVASAAPHGHPSPMAIAQMPPLLQLSVALNRGLAQVHVAFLSLALLLFGWALMARNRLLGGAGVLAGLYPVAWQLSGRFSPETTTMPWIVFPQGAWLIAVAVIMWRDATARAGGAVEIGESATSGN